jgi:hypothetical protein
VPYVLPTDERLTNSLCNGLRITLSSASKAQCPGRLPQYTYCMPPDWMVRAIPPSSAAITPSP